MQEELTQVQRQHLRQLQRQRRNDDGYVQVAVLLLDKGCSPASVAVHPGLNQAWVYRYAATSAALGLDKTSTWCTSNSATGGCSPAPS